MATTWAVTWPRMQAAGCASQHFQPSGSSLPAAMPQMLCKLGSSSHQAQAGKQQRRIGWLQAELIPDCRPTVLRMHSWSIPFTGLAPHCPACRHTFFTQALPLHRKGLTIIPGLREIIVRIPSFSYLDEPAK